MAQAQQLDWREAQRRLRNHLFLRDVEPLRAPLLAHCFRLARERSAADDLCQETLLRGFAASEVCTGPTDMRRYLFRVATNLWLDTLRKRGHEARAKSRLEALAVEDPGHEPASAWLELLARRLTPRELEVLVLRVAHGYSSLETAVILGTTEPAVKMAKSRASRRVRELQEEL